MMILIQIIQIFAVVFTATTYIYLLKKIREEKDDLGVSIDNYFVLKFWNVYKAYSELRKRKNLHIGVLFYIHIISLITMIVLAYYLDGKKVMLF